MNLFDFWGLTFGGMTRDSYNKKNGEKKLWPGLLIISLSVVSIFVLHILISIMWK
jgi:hypothetical protein